MMLVFKDQMGPKISAIIPMIVEITSISVERSEKKHLNPINPTSGHRNDSQHEIAKYSRGGVLQGGEPEAEQPWGKAAMDRLYKLNQMGPSADPM